MQKVHCLGPHSEASFSFKRILAIPEILYELSVTKNMRKKSLTGKLEKPIVQNKNFSVECRYMFFPGYL